MAGGSLTVLQAEPPLPAEATTKIPAACVFSMITLSVSAAHPSLGGQPQLLFITWGRFVGSGLLPVRSVGAMNHSKHSV
jgi:hypothetical protein